MTPSEAASIQPGDRLRGEDGEAFTVAFIFPFEVYQDDRLQPAWLFLDAQARQWHRYLRCSAVETVVLA